MESPGNLPGVQLEFNQLQLEFNRAQTRAQLKFNRIQPEIDQKWSSPEHNHSSTELNQGQTRAQPEFSRAQPELNQSSARAQPEFSQSSRKLPGSCGSPTTHESPHCQLQGSGYLLLGCWFCLFFWNSSSRTIEQYIVFNLHWDIYKQSAFIFSVWLKYKDISCSTAALVQGYQVGAVAALCQSVTLVTGLLTK